MKNLETRSDVVVIIDPASLSLTPSYSTSGQLQLNDQTNFFLRTVILHFSYGGEEKNTWLLFNCWLDLFDGPRCSPCLESLAVRNMIFFCLKTKECNGWNNELMIATWMARCECNDSRTAPDDNQYQGLDWTELFIFYQARGGREGGREAVAGLGERSDWLSDCRLVLFVSQPGPALSSSYQAISGVWSSSCSPSHCTA